VVLMSLWKTLNARWGSGAGEIDELRIDASTNSAQTTSYPHHEIHSNSHYFIEDFATDFDAAETLDFCLTTSNTAAWIHLLFAYECTGLCQLDIYEKVALTANAGALVVQRGNNRAKCFSGIHDGGDNDATVMADSTAAFTVDALIGWKIYNITDGSYGIITDNDATSITVAALVGGTGNDWDDDDQYEINRSLSLLRANQTITDLGIRMSGQSSGSADNPNRGTPGGTSRESELILRPNTAYVFRFTGGVNDSILTYQGEWYEHADKH
jgi:hypothetical protein